MNLFLAEDVFGEFGVVCWKIKEQLQNVLAFQDPHQFAFIKDITKNTYIPPSSRPPPSRTPTGSS